MLVGREWNMYSTTRRDLRVSLPTPGSSQRSTYWLSLPKVRIYLLPQTLRQNLTLPPCQKFAIPLVAVSAVLNWLVSQSIFLVRLSHITGDPTREAPVYFNRIGFSAIAVIILVTAGTLSVLSVLTPAILMKLDPNMPVLRAGCSVVISAACHAPEGDEDSHLREIKWGAVEADCDKLSKSSLLLDDSRAAVELVPIPLQRHCCFTTFEVEPPISGERCI